MVKTTLTLCIDSDLKIEAMKLIEEKLGTTISFVVSQNLRELVKQYGEKNEKKD